MAEQLPLANYDELPAGTLKHRIRSLTEDELAQLLEHERQHAHRIPVIEMLNHRVHELQEGATPSPGAESEPVDVPGHSASGSPVSPQGPREKGRPTEQGTRSSTGKGMEHD